MQSFPIPKLLFRLSWPVILSLLVQGLYGVVDNLYLARLGETALSATSLALVVQNLQMFTFTGIATGMNALVSRAIGAGNFRRAKDVVLCGMVIQGIISMAMLSFGVFGTMAYFTVSTDDANVIREGAAYLRPCCIFSLVVAAQITFERLLQSAGFTRHMLYAQAAGSFINIALDPILIFGWFGLPALGTEGAASATVIGQTVAAGLALFFNIKKNRLLFDRLLQKSKTCFSLIGEVCRIGIPSAVTGIIAALSGYCINFLLIETSATANAAFGVYLKLEQMGLVPAQGFAAGLITAIAFFYGKRNQKRIRKTLRWGAVYIGSWSILCALMFIFIPEVLIRPFQPTAQMLRIGIPAFRIVGSTFLLSGFLTVLTTYLQAVGYTMFSLMAVLSRQLFVRIPSAILFARFADISLIWWSWPLSEISSDLVCLIFFIRTYRRIAAAMPEPPPKIADPAVPRS